MLQVREGMGLVLVMGSPWVILSPPGPTPAWKPYICSWVQVPWEYPWVTITCHQRPTSHHCLSIITSQPSHNLYHHQRCIQQGWGWAVTPIPNNWCVFLNIILLLNKYTTSAGTTTWQGRFPPFSSCQTPFSLWPGGFYPLLVMPNTCCGPQHPTQQHDTLSLETSGE